MIKNLFFVILLFMLKTAHTETIINTTTLPVAIVNVAPPSDVCIDISVFFNGSLSTNVTTFSWSFPQGTPSVSSSATPSVIFNTPGNHTYSLIVTNACGSDTLNENITVIDKPNAIISFSPDSNICTGTNVQFDATNSSDFSFINWSFPEGGASISTASGTNPTINFSSPGIHNFSVIVLGICGADTINSSIEIDICTSIKNLTSKTIFTSYFNPKNNTIELNTNNIKTGKYNFIVTNSFGQKIITQKIELIKNKKYIQSFDNNTNGIYYINIYNNNRKYNSKLFKN